MLGRIVKRDHPIEMRSTLRDVPRTQQGNAHKAMPDHERNCGSLFLSKRQEMGRKIANHIAIECP